MVKNMRGFTVTEMIVVIMIIGIIATFIYVSYGNSQTRALNVSRFNELRAWQKSFEQYKAANNGNYPDVPSRGYCLGTSFPSQRCRDYGLAINFYTEADSIPLMDALKTYDPPLSGPRIPVNGTVGPYAEYYSDVIHLTIALKGASTDCPDSTYYVWGDGNGRILCRIKLQR
jgi:prepilin-type N-terminal cleavage/methylation domain-containing protein